jgi:hypothetical protein
MSEKLGIKIEGPTINIKAPELKPVSKGYKVLMMFSLLFMVVGILVLSAEVFDFPYNEPIYHFMNRLIPVNF